MIKNKINMDHKWEELLLEISKRFKVLADFDFMLFIIGIQERGLGYRKYSKDEKMDLMNLARCSLFAKKGFYKSVGVDEGNWPEFEVVQSLEDKLPSEREKLLKEAMVDYFKDKF